MKLICDSFLSFESLFLTRVFPKQTSLPDFAVPLTSECVNSVAAVEPAVGSLLARRIAAG